MTLTAGKCQFRTFTANEIIRAESVIAYASSASGSAFASGGRAAAEPGRFRDYSFLSHT